MSLGLFWNIEFLISTGVCSEERNLKGEGTSPHVTWETVKELGREDWGRAGSYVCCPKV